MIKIVPVNKNKTLIVKIHNEQIKQAKAIMLFLKKIQDYYIKNKIK